MQQCIRILVNGIVQGVGFRPFIYGLAKDFTLNGTVKNTPQGVEIILACDQVKANQFIEAMHAKLPPLAKIDQLAQSAIALDQAFMDFQILTTTEGAAQTRISADVAICSACLDELFDANSRYYHYPFVNCTHCGPRYSVIESLPYDRPKTALKDFPLCPECLTAYQDPLDRRYHAQATACAHCGPTLSHAFETVAHAIHAGQIIALKNNSGFHLIVDAKNDAAVQLLRERKRRPNKPFALMALNPQSIAQYVTCSDDAAAMLQSRQAPIVLMQCLQKSTVQALISAHIAPGLSQLGFMVPSTPLHYLLFYYLLGCPQGTDWLSQANDIVLVMTSANLSGDSIIADNASANTQLTAIADLIVTHNRGIAMKSDDSVVQVKALPSAQRRHLFHTEPPSPFVGELEVGKRLLPSPLAGEGFGVRGDSIIRRARGYAPETIKLAEKFSHGLALGTLLKNTICFTRGNEAFISQYLGDMQSQDNIDYFHQVLTHYQDLFGLQFEFVATDKHPDIYPSQYAETLGVPVFAIQHHEAHLGAVIAEHGLTEPALGLVLDGYGYGHAGEAWGGELFLCDPVNAIFERCGSLAPMLYCSGDKVQQEPWRMAVSLAKQWNLPLPKSIRQLPLFDAYQELLQTVTSARVRRDNDSTTSCGRLFDAVSSLLNVCYFNTYEGEAAMRLEALVEQAQLQSGLCEIDAQNQLNCQNLLHAVCQSKTTQKGSELFHGGLVMGLSEWLIQNAKQQQCCHIILNGGCFQNSVLLLHLKDQLQRVGLSVHTPVQLPFNDGGISLGQAWIAGKRYQILRRPPA